MKDSEEIPQTLSLLKFFSRNGKTLLIACSLAGILSVAVTFFLEEEFVSFSTIFPTSNNSIDATIDNPNFGYDVEADRLMQILQSNVIQDSVIKKFDLKNYYRIDTTRNIWIDQLNKKYRQSVKFTRTPYMSIIISAQTNNPQLSTDIVNYILSIIDKVRDRIYKSNLYIAEAMLREEYEKVKFKVDTLLIKLNEERQKTNLPDLILVGGANINIDLGKTSGSNNENNSYFEQRINQFKAEQQNMADIKMRYEKAKRQIRVPIPKVYIIDRAMPSFKKVFPSYTLNFLFSVAGTFLITIATLMIREKYHEIKDQI